MANAVISIIWFGGVLSYVGACMLCVFATKASRANARRVFCDSCGYDRVGLATIAICPECGGQGVTESPIRIMGVKAAGSFGLAASLVILALIGVPILATAGFGAVLFVFMMNVPVCFAIMAICGFAGRGLSTVVVVSIGVLMSGSHVLAYWYLGFIGTTAKDPFVHLAIPFGIGPMLGYAALVPIVVDRFIVRAQPDSEAGQLTGSNARK